MKPHTVSRRPIMWLPAAGLLLAACGLGAEEATPTLSVEQIQTEAVATFASDLTATALAMPTSTPTETETPTPFVTDTPAAAVTAVATVAGPVATASCYGLTFVSDVTIPDNTTMTPGQKFTKTWRIRNSGSCAWQSGFNFRLIGGEAMGGSTVSLPSTIQPGGTFDVSVNLTAPTTAGTYRGNWRMANASGTLFGDEVYVLIVVGGPTATRTAGASVTPTGPATAVPTATSTPSLTPTEEVTPSG